MDKTPAGRQEMLSKFSMTTMGFKTSYYPSPFNQGGFPVRFQVAIFYEILYPKIKDSERTLRPLGLGQMKDERKRISS